MRSKNTKSPETAKELAKIQKRDELRGKLAGKPQNTAKVDTAKAFEMRFRNKLSYRAIGEYFGVTEVAVRQRLKPYAELMEGANVPDKEMAQMFKNVAVKHLIEAASSSKAKALKADRNMMAAAIAVDKSRLLSGESTENVGVLVKMVVAACSTDQLPPCPVTEMVTERTEQVESDNDSSELAD